MEVVVIKLASPPIADFASQMLAAQTRRCRQISIGRRRALLTLRNVRQVLGTCCRKVARENYGQ